jgi:hypothetical protein
MTTFAVFNNHLKSVYDAFWNTRDSARLILLSTTVDATTNLSTVLAAELATANGYTSGGAAVAVHTSTYDAGQLRTEGRPAAVSFTASGAGLTFNAWAIIAAKDAVDELCLFHNYASAQTIAAGNSREITVEINLGKANADVEAAD